MSKKTTSETCDTCNADVLPAGKPQAPRSVPISEVGDDRAGNRPYSGEGCAHGPTGGSTPVEVLE